MLTTIVKLTKGISMLKLYENVNTFNTSSTNDMLLDSVDTKPQYYFINTNGREIEDKYIEIAELYQFNVVDNIKFLPVLKDTILDLLDEPGSVSICIDNLTEWMIGVDENANNLEELYTEDMVDILKELLFSLNSVSKDNDIRIMCNDYLLQYIVDILHSKCYTLEES